MKYKLHFQMFVPPSIKKRAEDLRGARLTFGPHATQRWDSKLGTLPRPTTLPETAYFLEIVIARKPKDVVIDTVLFRYNLDENTDVIMAVVERTKFVCSVWRVPRWYGLEAGRPKDPSKYLTQKSFQALLNGGNTNEVLRSEATPLPASGF